MNRDGNGGKGRIKRKEAAAPPVGKKPPPCKPTNKKNLPGHGRWRIYVRHEGKWRDCVPDTGSPKRVRVGRGGMAAERGSARKRRLKA